MPTLDGKHGINRAALGAGLVHLLGGVVGIDQVLGRNAQGLEIGAEGRVAGVLVQDARDADAQCGAALHGRHARFLPAGERIARQRVGHQRRIERFEHHLGRDFGHVREVLAGRVHALLDFAHGVDVFHQAPLATVVDDEALGIRRDGNLGRLGPDVLDGHAGLQLHVNKGAQALVLAEVAAACLRCGG